MKKILSLLLVLSMLFALAAPVSAAQYQVDGSPIPVVTIYGDGEAIYDTEGNKVFHFSEMLSMLGGSEEGSLGEATINILMPFLLEGIVNDEWDNYYAALEKEIGELFTEARYDENGENWNGTDISDHCRELQAYQLSRDAKKPTGYWYADYHFFYDWRQDPMKTADEFHEYVEAVKKVTGAEKVAIIARCLGTSVVMAYLAKYGFQLAAIAESRDYVADQFATVKKASFGATTSTVYEPLDADYIAARVAVGNGKYISPDKRIDASTCAFPDSTWFTKGITHSKWTDFETSVLLKVVTADKQLTVDDFEYTQFIVYDNETETAYPMTEDNYKTESWEANKNMDKPDDKYGLIFSAVSSLINWIIELVKFLQNKFSK